jgi:hypothetical protein
MNFKNLTLTKLQTNREGKKDSYEGKDEKEVVEGMPILGFLGSEA